jgi:hypothetical protein
MSSGMFWATFICSPECMLSERRDAGKTFVADYMLSICHGFHPLGGNSRRKSTRRGMVMGFSVLVVAMLLCEISQGGIWAGSRSIHRSFLAQNS